MYDIEVTLNRTIPENVVLSDIIAAPYLPTVPHYKDDYCIYQKHLYRCKQNIPAEQWTASHWEQTTIDNEIHVLEDKIEDVRVIFSVTNKTLNITT